MHTPRCLPHRVVHHSKDLAREIAAKAKEFDADVNVKVKFVEDSSEDIEVSTEEDISEMLVSEWSSLSIYLLLIHVLYTYSFIKLI